MRPYVRPTYPQQGLTALHLMHRASFTSCLSGGESLSLGCIQGFPPRGHSMGVAIQILCHRIGAKKWIPKWLMPRRRSGRGGVVFPQGCNQRQRHWLLRGGAAGGATALRQRRHQQQRRCGAAHNKAFVF